MNQLESNILIVEDDEQILKFITYSIKKEGYNTFTAENGKEAFKLLDDHSIDLIVLDLGLPDIDGIEIIKRIRKESDITIIVVSARDLDKDKVFALDIGADDYLTKPFSVEELMARIRVAIRHMQKRDTKAEINIFQVGDIKVDFEKRIVCRKSEEIHLTPMEYDLLCLLAKNAGKVLTTSYIIKEIWGIHYGSDTQVLRRLMASLRRKIEDVPARPRYIITEIGIGYRLIDE